MNAKKSTSSVILLCPTCGGSNFSSISIHNIDCELQKCASCDREITSGELIRENSENINQHIDDIKTKLANDAEKRFKKKIALAFKGNKFIKIK